MEFIGAAEFFFWQGVAKGVNATMRDLFDLDQYVNGMFHANNPTTDSCREAYAMGFFFGGALTQEEYNELTAPEKDDIVTNWIDKVIKKQTIQTNVIGNC